MFTTSRAAAALVVLSLGAGSAFAGGLSSGSGLDEAARLHFNIGVSSQDQIAAPSYGRNTHNVSSRNVATSAGAAQLAASAGLSPQEAAGMTLSEIAATFFNRNVSVQDRQTVK